MKRMALGFVFLLVAAATVSAQVKGKPKIDARLREALTEAELHFTEMDDGDFKLHFTLEDERTHLVFAESKTQVLGPIEVREVWAIGWKGDKAPTARIGNKLLQDNARRKVGAWELHEQEDGGFYAIFNVKVSADADGEALKSIVFGVAQTADEMEKDLLGTDDY